VWAVALALIAAGCAPNTAGSPPGVALIPSTETECERSLQELADLIAAAAAEPTLKPAVLDEARELRAAAAGLYLDGLYELALQLIDEAFALLRGDP
jgi:hypothetical protein